LSKSGSPAPTQPAGAVRLLFLRKDHVEPFPMPAQADGRNHQIGLAAAAVFHFGVVAADVARVLLPGLPARTVLMGVRPSASPPSHGTLIHKFTTRSFLVDISNPSEDCSQQCFSARYVPAAEPTLVDSRGPAADARLQAAAGGRSWRIRLLSRPVGAGSRVGRPSGSR